MLYERLLDLAPGMRLERRLAERVAASLVIGLLLSVPLCAFAAFILVSSAIHALLMVIWDAGRIVGLLIRDACESMLALRVEPR